MGEVNQPDVDENGEMFEKNPFQMQTREKHKKNELNRVWGNPIPQAYKIPTSQTTGNTHHIRMAPLMICRRKRGCPEKDPTADTSIYHNTSLAHYSAHLHDDVVPKEAAQRRTSSIYKDAWSSKLRFSPTRRLSLFQGLLCPVSPPNLNEDN